MIKVALELQPCVKQRSGIGVYTYEISKRLKNSNDITYYGNILDFADLHRSKEELAELSYKINLNKSISYSIYRRIWDFLPFSYNTFFKDKSDIYHFFNYIVPPNINGIVITTIHDLAYIDYPETLDPKNLKRISNSIEYSVKRSKFIVTISKYSKQRILDNFDIDENSIKIINPSFEKLNSFIDFNIIKNKFNISSSYILYVGNIEPRKNIVRLIESFYHLKKQNLINQALVIVGGNGWLYKDVFKKVLSLNLQNDIIFTGFVSKEEKASLYKNADLFLFPSLYEGFGIPILEAMSLGTPVVCSNTSSMPEVGGNAAFYVNPLSVEDISAGILKVLSDSSLQKDMIDEGYRQIKKFSWDESAKKLEKLYLSI